MNTLFAEKKEAKDYILLEEFNSFLGLKDLGRCPEKHTSDASGITSTCEIANIELKSRNQTLTEDLIISGITKEGRSYTASTIFIEAHKAGDLLLDYICEGKIPLYINFLNDGYVVVYNLSRLRHRPKKIGKKIWSELYQGFELAKREELQLQDAYIYKLENNEYKLIQKP